jgi:hypothetical protein
MATEQTPIPIPIMAPASSDTKEKFRVLARELKGLNCSIRDQVDKVVKAAPFADLSALFKEYTQKRNQIMAEQKATVDQLRVFTLF